MKTLSCGTNVKSSVYYFVLDFNDRDDKVMMTTLFSKDRLCDLTYDEFLVLYKTACELQLPDAFK